MKIPVEILRATGPALNGGLVNILVSDGSATKYPSDDIFLIFDRPNLNGIFIQKPITERLDQSGLKP